MKGPKGNIINERDGFTLIELIVTLVVASILGTMLFQFMGVGVTQSGVPLHWLQEEYELSEAIEQITSDYKDAIKGPSFNLANFKSAIETNYSAYIVTAQTKYIDFACTTDCTESGINTDILKVQIEKNDQNMTVLFTQ